MNPTSLEVLRRVEVALAGATAGGRSVNRRWTLQSVELQLWVRAGTAGRNGGQVAVVGRGGWWNRGAAFETVLAPMNAPFHRVGGPRDAIRARALEHNLRAVHATLESLGDALVVEHGGFEHNLYLVVNTGGEVLLESGAFLSCPPLHRLDLYWVLQPNRPR